MNELSPLEEQSETKRDIGKVNVCLFMVDTMTKNWNIFYSFIKIKPYVEFITMKICYLKNNSKKDKPKQPRVDVNR